MDPESTKTLEQLSSFFSSHPSITLLTPFLNSISFNTLRPTFVNPNSTPLAILRPSSTEDVSIIVQFLASRDIPFTVRVGGHDMHGRSAVDGCVVLDLRLLNHVVVNEDKKTAAIGGGILIGDLLSALEMHGLVTPVGTVSSVGYVGWAMYGGYGPYSSVYGLGVDQIVGAKVVNASGEVIDADEELLKGIKGAGGAFGVIVEVEVRVYELESILAGTLLFTSTDLPTTLRTFTSAYNALTHSTAIPAALNLFPAVLPSPPMPTPTFALIVTWTSPDHSAGQEWINRIATLTPSATVTANTVQSTAPKAWADEVSKLVATNVQGRMYTISLRQITQEVSDVIARYTSPEKMPRDPALLFDMHELRSVSPSANHKTDSVFNAREPHFVVEICAIAANPENLETVLKWGEEFQGALKRTDRGNILPASYISFLAREEIERNMGGVFGGHLGFLTELKRRLDPVNVFRAAISNL
ncbi:FAD-binding oxidoreductase [Aspergillus mulundensis]|uniref:FAD-binding PCMH-type domain-containing protein n=1 Tax=Aspergillus mulundensis TaxID=1810919 RepID=A0A3D8QVW4_9EURO|nr:Uncharacterized protein DSM5745_09654 [Aspergillus mulundensis]RDW65915.1 Uncharacterized protein DSM5745_09654 [Aspergillus mulundensis]